MIELPSPFYAYVSQVMFFLSLSILVILLRKRFVGFMGRMTQGQDPIVQRDLYAVGAIALVLVSIVLMGIGFPGWASFLSGSVVGLIAPLATHRYRRKKYLHAFEAALAEALQTLASSLRAGLTLRDSLAVVAENAPDPLAGEVAYALKEYGFGIPIEQALDGIRQRVPTINTNIAFGAMIISSQLGGNLPAMLKKIVVTIRERTRVEGKLKALTAQGRSQAFLLCSAPPVLGIGMYLYDPQKMSLLTDYWVGQIFLGIAIVLELVGIFVTSRVMRLEV